MTVAGVICSVWVNTHLQEQVLDSSSFSLWL